MASYLIGRNGLRSGALSSDHLIARGHAAGVKTVVAIRTPGRGFVSIQYLDGIVGYMDLGRFDLARDWAQRNPWGLVFDPAFSTPGIRRYVRP